MTRQKILIISCFTCNGFCCANSHGKMYTDQYLYSLRVPVGGVGTGNILIGCRGNIEHVEVFNQPDRQRRLEKTFFALWYQQDKCTPVAKILEREFFPPYQESTHKYVAGLPRLRNAEFVNHFPLHHWRFKDEEIPIMMSLEAFSPFIPLDVDQSSYPLVAFYWDFKNTTKNPLEASVVFNMENPIIGEAISNLYFEGRNVRGIRFTTSNPENINYQGSLFLGTTVNDVDIQTHWFPGEWRDEAHIFWDDFSQDGTIESKLSDWHTAYKSTSYNKTTRRMASVLVHFSLAPGQHIRIPFYLAWYFPKRIFKAPEVFGIQEAIGKSFENVYAKLFNDELDVLKQFLQQEKPLYQRTARFAELIDSSTFPENVREALTTQAASLRTHLIQVTSKGHVHGFEGVLNDGWCCPGTCTHVWNYAQTLASLFPSLERSMREIEFLHDTFDQTLCMVHGEKLVFGLK